MSQILNPLFLLGAFVILIKTPVALADKPADAKNKCRYILTAVEDKIHLSEVTEGENGEDNPKAEIDLIRDALAAHFSVKSIGLETTRKALQLFTEIVDPFGLVITQSEHDRLATQSDEDLRNIQKHTLLSPSRAFYDGIRHTITERYNHLIIRFSKEKSFRDRVFSRLQLLREKYVTQKRGVDTSKHPQNEAEMEDKFLDVVANFALQFQASRHTNKINNQEPLSERDAITLSIRKIRSDLYEINRSLRDDQFPLVIAKAFISALDPHSNLHPPLEAARVLRDLRGELVGLGVDLTPHIKGSHILRVVPNGAAAESDIRTGDIITHIELEVPQGDQASRITNRTWLPVRNHTTEHISPLLQGAENSILNVKIDREGKTLLKNIRRKRISQSSSLIKIKVESTPQGNVAQINFESFYLGVGKHLREELKKILDSYDIKAVVLDIRGNPGGFIGEIPAVAGLFIPNGTAYYTLESNTDNVIEKFEIPPDNKVLWEGPLVVQINNFTASAAEALVGLLQDYQRCVTVGSLTTHGKGSAQILIKFPKHSSIARITVALYFTPSGHSPQKYGIPSDIELPQPSYGNFYERNLDHAIEQVKLPYLITEDEILMPNLPEIIQQLKTKSQERQSHWPQPDNDKQIYERNTEEAIAIAQDLVSILSQ